MRAKVMLAPAVSLAIGVASALCCPSQSRGQGPIPHGQSAPPGPALSPADAIRKMTVPEGFRVELVAGEPDIVNPVAMTFDERGRIWITESLEYPRSSPGEGRDRVKIVEDKDGDGKADTFTVFAGGLNIPSGIAVGYGGVWVANSPDILFLQDTDGDGKADRREVVVTGFGRDDTHELPNSLTWGPDGWLYGWNGVFNRSHVKYRGKEYKFTCAIFRINPRTRDFELYCEGTSNPWGIAWDNEGSAFASACVIDHLWHLTETGYYHRQGGEYPPFTWKLGSIVDHKHQQAAYCGIHFFDSDAYPERFRERLFMGNIHGNSINVDRLERDGSTYRAQADPDFLEANDSWFMPVVQKTGPDGCLYILDWYDRYHCYQDARRDPEGIDRLKGRLYRVRYKDTPRAPRFDLARETSEQLIDRLASPNVLYRDLAQRVLAERNDGAARPKLQSLVLDVGAPRKARMHALWALLGARPLDGAFHVRLLADRDAGFRAWGVRAAGNAHTVDSAVSEKVLALVDDPSPDVLLQVAIAARKIEGINARTALLGVLRRCGDDELIPHIVWQNLHPLLEDQGDAFVRAVKEIDLEKSPRVAEILPRVIERLLARRTADASQIASLLEALSRQSDDKATAQALNTITREIQNGEVSGEELASLRKELGPVASRAWTEEGQGPLALDFALLVACCDDDKGLAAVRNAFRDAKLHESRRLQALETLLFLRDHRVLDHVEHALSTESATTSADFRGRVLAALGKLDHSRVAEVVLSAYPKMEPELQPKAIELLTQRTPWSKRLLHAIAQKSVSADALNVNQIRKLLSSKDEEIAKQVRAHWGAVREGRNPKREQLIAQMRAMLQKTPGDPEAGHQVFKKVCGQCHKIYGEGQEVGPDLTGSGRTDFEQLLSNVFDPNLVIGAAYQATTVATSDGRVLTGLLVEDNAQRIVLKTQGGKLETIPRGDVEEMKVSPLSLMPEDMEKQISTQELVDLFAFLSLDKHPSDPTAKRLPGTLENLNRAPQNQRRP
jgi:putative membrane-bound dehydrogenase-like protein